MTTLEELEQRLLDEPENLGLRVLVAGALHQAGRRDDSIELYRSVAEAYRDQGRMQQAIQMCRSILAIAPDDPGSREMLAALGASRPAGALRQPRPDSIAAPQAIEGEDGARTTSPTPRTRSRSFRRPSCSSACRRSWRAIRRSSGSRTPRARSRRR